jgi:hypothetical protein
LSRMFKHSIDIIQPLFSKHSQFWFHSFLFINTVCLNLFVTFLIIFSIWKYNTLKFLPESSPTFHLYHTWTLISTCTFTWHFDIIRNTTGWVLTSEAVAWRYE